MGCSSLKPVGIYVTAGVLTSALLSAACHNEARPGSTVWANLERVPASHILRIDELQQQAGFKLVLPSYVPQEMKHYAALWMENPAGSVGGEHAFQAAVDISANPSRKGRLEIDIVEWQRQTDESRQYFPYVEESTTIGQTTVTCRVGVADTLLMTPPGTTPSPAGDPSYICLWDTEELHLSVTVVWRPFLGEMPEPVPGVIASDIRDEAMKVVTSMIEHPYTP